MRSVETVKERENKNVYMKPTISLAKAVQYIAVECSSIMVSSPEGMYRAHNYLLHR